MPLLLLAACGGSSSRHLNLLATTGQGQALDPRNHERLNAAQTDAYVDELMQTMLEQAPIVDGKRQLLIHIHGGLKSYSSSFAEADAMAATMEQQGEYYPIFVVWPSNLTRTYLEHVFLLRQGKRSVIRGLLTSPLLLVGDLAMGVIRWPGNVLETLETDISTAGRTISRRQTNSQARQDSLLHSNHEKMTLIVGDERRSSWARHGKFALYLLTLPVKLVSLVFIDGFGEPAFDNMQRRTETMFRPPQEFAKEFNARSVDPTYMSEHQGGSGALARLLARLNASERVRSEVSITLVGHSMGTIVANRALRYFPELPVDRIIYMAAACTIGDFRDSVVPFLRAHPQTRFYNLSLHPRAESGEVQWSKLDLPPRGSLLEWIDNFLSNPETETDLTLGKWDNIMLASHLIPLDVRERVTLKSFPFGGVRSPTHHGAFNDFEFWRRGFWGEE